MSDSSKHFLNGKTVSEEELLISPRDLGFTRGYAVFDFLITYNGKPFKLDSHIDRLFNSADLINLKIPWTKDQIKKWIKKTLAANPPGEKTVKIIISGGLTDFILPKGEPTIIIMVDPRHPYPATLYENGIAVKTVRFKRANPRAKTNNYIKAISEMLSFDKKIEDAIYYDDTQVYEPTTSNLFAVIDNKLKTPKSKILPGITKEVLLEILNLDIPIVEEDFKIEDLMRADEVFLTSSNREIAPVVEIDGKKVGSGKVGPITREVIRQFSAYTQSH